jgi:hypothetical protein
MLAHQATPDLPLGDVGTWAVTFTYGQEPPQPGVDAAVAYAREWVRACNNDSTCALPARGSPWRARACKWSSARLRCSYRWG